MLPQSSDVNEHYDDLSDEDKSSQATQDANTLRDHASIVAHKARHAAARDHLQKAAANNKNALSGANRRLRETVGKKLKSAFGEQEGVKTAPPTETFESEAEGK